MAVFHRKTWGRQKSISSLPCLYQTRKGAESLTTWYKKKKKKTEEKKKNVLQLWQEMYVPAALNCWIDEKIKVSYYTGLLPSSSGGVPESPGIGGGGISIQWLKAPLSINHHIWWYYTHYQNLRVSFLVTPQRLQIRISTRPNQLKSILVKENGNVCKGKNDNKSFKRNGFKLNWIKVTKKGVNKYK